MNLEYWLSVDLTISGFIVDDVICVIVIFEVVVGKKNLGIAILNGAMMTTKFPWLYCGCNAR